MSSSNQQKSPVGGNPQIGYDQSWYFHTACAKRNYPGLAHSKRADVCIIGGGYTGLSAAIELSEKGLDVVLLEAFEVGSGASGRNGGVLGVGQRKDQDTLESWLGRDDARKMWQIASDANQLVRDRIERFNIDCDLKNGELHAAHKQRYESELWGYADHLEKYYGHENLKKLSHQEVSDMMGVDTLYGGYVDYSAGHIHPLNLALGLASAADELGATIFENTPALGYTQTGDKVVVQTPAGDVTADYLVIGCNGYLGRLDDSLNWWQMPINNFILATEPLGESLGRSINRDDIAIVDTRYVVNFFHNSPDHRLIFGGGENYSSRFPRDIKAFVRKRMLKIYPQLEDVAIEFGWGGTLAITMRRMPHFGRKGRNIYWAQGYSGHGIHMANMGGKLVAEAICNQSEGFDLFANLTHFPFPGGRLLRWPALVAGMLYYSMLDRF